ncbi:MAG: hypothetical protein O2871_03935, partial [bacterium]|nr:hypothetical protein [bacterium]
MSGLGRTGTSKSVSISALGRIMARKLSESSINPEDLMHSSYREHVVKYLVGIISVQESVVVVAERGYGLSRLLRFITYGHYPVKPLSEIRLIYLNMLDFTATSAGDFISHLNEYLDNKKKNESLCFIIDELGLDRQSETYFKLLKGFRGKDRTHISFILGISLNKQKDFDIKNPPNYIEDLV